MTLDELSAHIDAKLDRLLADAMASDSPHVRLGATHMCIGHRLDALLNGAITRAAMLWERQYAVRPDGKGWLAIKHNPADPDDRPDHDTFEIDVLSTPKNGLPAFTRYYVDINRERDPRNNGKVTGVHIAYPPAGDVELDVDEATCRKLVEALTGAVLVEVSEAREAA